MDDNVQVCESSLLFSYFLSFFLTFVSPKYLFLSFQCFWVLSKTSDKFETGAVTFPSIFCVFLSPNV